MTGLGLSRDGMNEGQSPNALASETVDALASETVDALACETVDALACETLNALASESLNALSSGHYKTPTPIIRKGKRSCERDPECPFGRIPQRPCGRDPKLKKKTRPQDLQPSLLAAL